MNKLIIFKWTSLLLSIGCITFFIVSDIYNDNRRVVAEVQIEEMATVITPEPTAKEVAHASSSECETAINAYKAQIVSNNNQISKTIVDRYNKCMEIPTETRIQAETVKEKKK